MREATLGPPQSRAQTLGSSMLGAQIVGPRMYPVPTSEPSQHWLPILVHFRWAGVVGELFRDAGTEVGPVAGADNALLEGAGALGSSTDGARPWGPF